MPFPHRILVPALFAALAFCGCGDSDSSTSKGPVSTQGTRASSRVADQMSDTQVIALTKLTASKDGPGTISEWVDAQLKQMTGQIMFPRWTAERRGASKFEVEFTFTLIDGANRIVKRGYAWTIDVALNMVGPSRELSPAYEPTFDRNASSRQEYKRVTEEQSSLE